MAAPVAIALLIVASWSSPAAAGNATGSEHGRAPDVATPKARLAGALEEALPGLERFDAQVWFAAIAPRLAPFVADPGARLELLDAVARAAAQHDLDPELVLALIEVESAFDRFAVSRAGAQGLMQVMPFWKHELGRPEDNLTDPLTNLRYGTTILAHYLQREDGDVVRAMMRYYGDRTDLGYPERVLRAWNRRWRTRSDQDVAAVLAACRRAALASCTAGG